MVVSITAEQEYLAKACQEILRAFYPGEGIQINEENSVITLELEKNKSHIKVKAIGQGKVFQASDRLGISSEAENTARRLARLVVLRCLEDITGRSIGPWGILTGIRPTKIVHRIMDRGLPQGEIINQLTADYALVEAKARLLTEVCTLQRGFLHSPEKAGGLISIYIGIPFCPTRCVYCSFPAYSTDRHGHLVEPFLQALQKEISALGQGIKGLGLEVETVYIGGGTPTSLNEGQLAGLLEAVTGNLVSGQTREFTLEAGRPDSINMDKLQLMKRAGVNRISINPQSMNMETLRTIGRSHSPEEIRAAFTLAKESGFDNINMDIIVGLPGETLEHINRTLSQIAGLGPDNLTVHTLALKRASRLKEEQRIRDIKGDNQETQDQNVIVTTDVVAEMLARCYEGAKGMGMHPYYLYRQKQMLGHLENVGFAQQGKDCIYNIQMMEERQTVVGLGAGAGSKWVDPKDWTLLNTYNPKDPQNYIERVEEMVNFKLEKLNYSSRSKS
ncbi:MAG: coproporphyrinogen dehydrogenase HemZ [Clostridia bacterium]|nr:coproporphyrinogen dehydrogenase HemZ [Clostridia bacterium]